MQKRVLRVQIKTTICIKNFSLRGTFNFNLPSIERSLLPFFQTCRKFLSVLLKNYLQLQKSRINNDYQNYSLSSVFHLRSNLLHGEINFALELISCAGKSFVPKLQYFLNVKYTYNYTIVLFLTVLSVRHKISNKFITSR